MKRSAREPIAGRFYGIFDVEGEGDAVAIFPSKVAAETYILACRTLPEDSDNHLTEYHQVFPVDIAGAWWNSYEADPRADNPLTPEEILEVCGG